MVRIILGIVAGIIVAGVVTLLIEMVGHSVFPVASDLAMTDPAYLAAVPLPAKLIVMLAWFLASLIGGYLANRLSQTRWACWAIAGFMIAGAAYSFTQITHPTWMIAGGIVLPLLAAAMTSRLTAPGDEAALPTV